MLKMVEIKIGLLACLTGFVFLTTAVVYAQTEPEVISHTFNEEPPTIDLDRASELAEKYIMGGISEAELIELKTLKHNDLRDLDAYKEAYVARQILSNSLEDDSELQSNTTKNTSQNSNIVDTSANNINARNIFDVTPSFYWFIALTFFNTVALVVIVVMFLFNRRRVEEVNIN